MLHLWSLSLLACNPSLTTGTAGDSATPPTGELFEAGPDCDSVEVYLPPADQHAVPSAPSSTAVQVSLRLSEGGFETSAVLGTLVDSMPLDVVSLWYPPCGEGLEGELTLVPGVYTDGALEVEVGTETRVQADTAGVYTVEIPGTFTYTEHAFAGCDLVAGEPMDTRVSLTITAVAPIWTFGSSCPSAAVVSGADLRLVASVLDGSGNPIRGAGLGRPEVVLSGDGVLIEAHATWIDELRFTGDGTVTATIDGQVVNTIQVVPADQITRLGLHASNNQQTIEAGGSRTLRSIYGQVEIEPDGVWAQDLALCGRPNLAAFELASADPSLCAVEAHDCHYYRPDSFLDAVGAESPGICSLSVTHTPSGTVAEFEFTID